MFCGFCWWCMLEIKSLKIWLRRVEVWGRRQRAGGENKFICYRLQVYDGILCVQHVNKSYVIYPFVEWLLLWASSCCCFHNVIRLRYGKKSSFYCSHQFFKFNFPKIQVAEAFLPLKEWFIVEFRQKTAICPKFLVTLKIEARNQANPSQHATIQHRVFRSKRKVSWQKFWTTVV